MKKILLAITVLYLFICNISFACPPTLKVGVTADYPPFEFTKQGQLQGFSIDFAKKLGKELGMKVEFQDMAFSSLIPALQSRKIDVIISSVNVTEERKKSVDFSIPYYSSVISFLSLKSSGITSIEDMRGKIAGAQLGSTMEEFAKQMSNDFSFKVIALDSNLVLLQELKKKIIDVLIVEEVQGKAFANNNKNIENHIIPEKYYKDRAYSIALRKGSKYLEGIDNAITKFQKDGTLEKLKQKWIK